VRKTRGEPEIGAVEFLSLVKEKAALVGLDEALLTRSVNDGFSGGEKKRNEILQLGLLDPVLAILDETDSGLDIDALKTVAHGINLHRRADRAMLVVTHYQRLLEYVVPDVVHVIAGGRILRSGGKELAGELEEKGYGWLAPDAGGSPAGTSAR
jgi:Fe-S cluster assembly ATP-binding protein